ncbi:MAG TPA: MFS transporter [Actinomycetota bacterium]|nr:MFS transporter [Actinomycetota bacterium]
MAVTERAPAGTVVVPEERGRLGHPLVLFGAVAVLLLLMGWAFLRDPTITAPTRDPAWYTWRAGVAAEARPVEVVKDWGPFSMFSGGYRVTVPLAGAVLEGAAGTSRFTFSALLMIGMPILAGLGMAAFAYRHRPDPLLYLLTLLASAGMFLTTPYVGYLDNITVLTLLALLLAFLGPARTSWGARSAVFLFGFVAAFTHPTTCVIFGMVLLAALGLRFLTSRLSLARALQVHGPATAACGFGMLAGLALWVAGIWGVGGPALLKDAALPPPYTRTFFLERLWQWVASLQPAITFPLILLAIASVVWTARRRREPADTYAVVSILYLLPLVGVLGWLVGSVYPYYRFMNATTAVMLLAGLGAWVAVRWALSLRGSGRPLGMVAAAAVVLALVYVFAAGWRGWTRPGNQWIDQGQRVALAAVRGLVEAMPDDHPIVFVNDFRQEMVAYGWSKTYLNVERTALPGDAILRSFAYFGDVDDLLAGRPTDGADPTYDRVSRGFWEELHPPADAEAPAIPEAQPGGLDAYDAPPIVVMVEQFNRGTENGEAFETGSFPEGAVPIGDDVVVLTGSGFARPSGEAIEAARRAGEAQAAAFRDHPGLLGDPLHLLRVLAALALLLVVPGLLAARWFEVRDLPSRIALVPGLSIAMVLAAAILVAAVARGPFGAGQAWASVGLATAAGVGLEGLARRREAGRGRVGPALNRFLNGMFAAFSNRGFAFLMGAQFLAQMGDGIVQGSLAKSIAFQGERGFDVTSAPSTRYLLALVLILYVPYTFVSPMVGAFIDRYDRRRLLVVSNLARAGVVALVALAGLDRVPDGVIMVAILVTLACTRILLAVKSAGLPAVLSGRDLLQGNGLSQAGGAIFQVMGGGIALVGTSLLPAGIVALAGAAVYAVAALVARRVERLAVERRQVRFLDEVRRVFRDVAEGLREVAGRPAAALGLAGFQALRVEVFGFVALVFALQARYLLAGEGGDQLVVAIAGGTGAVGAGLGLVAGQLLKDRVAPARLLVAAMTAIGLGVIAFGGVPTLVGFSALTFVGALGYFLGKISADTIMQQALPDRFRGRGFSLFDVAYNLGWIAPALILFLVWREDRVREILIASGVVFLAVTAAVAAWARRLAPHLARTDDLAEPELAEGVR